MRVGLDMDGVIYNFVEDLRDYLTNNLHRSPETLPEPDRWEFWTDWNMSFKQFKYVMESGIESGELFANGPMYDGAEGINYLTSKGHTVHILTHRDHRVEQRTYDWFASKGLTVHSITLNGDKTAEEFDIYFDDKPENVAAVLEAGRKAFLLDRPWNQKAKEARVFGWPGILKAIDNLNLEMQAFFPLMGTTKIAVKAVPINDELMADHDVFDHSHDKVAESGGRKGVKPERMSLVPYEAVAEIAKVYGFGAEKYEPNNWRKGYPFSWSIDALERHIGKFKAGEDLDPESGLPHLAHAGFHILTILTWLTDLDRYGKFDDRYKPEGTHPDIN